MDSNEKKAVHKNKIKSILFNILMVLIVFCITQNLKASETSEGFINKLVDDVIDKGSEEGKGNTINEELARLKKAAEKEAAKAEAEYWAKYSDINDYVKVPQIFYTRTRGMFDKDDLPELYEFIKDDDYAPYWHTIALMITFISEDTNSVPILLNHFQRDDGDKNFSLKGKISSLALVGIIGGDLADSVLKKGVTIEGARELAKEWIEDELWQDEFYKKYKEMVIPRIQHAALRGLAYSKKKENRDYLEKLYLKEKNNLNTSQELGYKEALIENMALKGYLEENSIEALFNIPSASAYLSAKLPYISKYNF